MLGLKLNHVSKRGHWWPSLSVASQRPCSRDGEHMIGFQISLQSGKRNFTAMELLVYDGSATIGSIYIYIHTYILHSYIHTYMFVVVNFDALAQASDIQIRKETSCVPLLNAGFEPGAPDTNSVVSKMSFALPWQPPTDNISCIMFS